MIGGGVVGESPESDPEIEFSKSAPELVPIYPVPVIPLWFKHFPIGEDQD